MASTDDVTSSSVEMSGDSAMDKNAPADVLLTGDPFFNHLILRLAQKVECLQTTLREKKIDLRVKAGDSLPAPSSRPLPKLSAVHSSHRHAVFHDLESSQTTTELQHLVQAYTTKKLNFKHLREAVEGYQRSMALNESLEISTEEGLLQLDEQEMQFVSALLSEQRELCKDILDLQVSSIDLATDLIKAQDEFSHEYAYLSDFLKEQQNEMSSQESEENEGIKKKRGKLREEELKVERLRLILSRMAMWSKPENEEKEKKMMDLTLKCGKSVTQLRQEKML